MGGTGKAGGKPMTKSLTEIYHHRIEALILLDQANFESRSH